ncbi:DEAD/DEAH box helicase [Sulfurovum sp. CS9]|uniref:DEAD/DEAH box helicase n=1 Tax=Sulfurovum sp. CS9 TaxID=3391146 RepID=UPI0039EA6BAC
MNKLQNKQQKFELRPYQTDIVERATKAKGSVLVELATGGGKSVIAKEIIKRETDQGGIALIVAPKINLLEQLAGTFTQLQPQIIHGAKDYNKQHNVFVSTLQTAYKRKLGFKPTMILIDETHYGFSGKMIKQLLDSFKGKVVGLSATPYDKQGKTLEGFKTHLNDYSLEYMITNGYLVPMISYQPVKVNLKGIRTTAGDYNMQDLDQKFNTIESVMQVVDATKEKIQQRKQALVFCITIKHSEAMAKAYNDAGVKAMAIHSQLTKEQQAEAMEAFKSGDVKVLTNADMLTTGFDHPPTDTIVLARATKSQNLYKQMVGRVLRLAPNKHDGVLLDCAEVISNLGLPTAPIRPKQENEAIEAKQSVCSECASTRIYRSIKKDTAYKVCAECGHHEEIESQTGYECEECGKIHGNDASFTADHGKLYLVCECGHETIVSEATTHDELQAIFDNRLIETLQRRITATYCTWLINNHGTTFIFRDEVKRQIAALNALIEQQPEQVTGLKMDTVQVYDGWRLISREYEANYLPTDTQPLQQNTQALKQRFYNTHSFDTAVTALDMLLEAESKEPLKEWVVDKTRQQINDSFVKGMEAMTVKRLKNLYSNNKDCNSVDAFIPYIEQQRA